jgi:aspartate kinase
MTLIVSKFGGTSMGDDIAMLRSAEIVKKQNSFFVLVSATSGTTDQLVELIKSAENETWLTCEKIIFSLREKHLAIANKLTNEKALSNELKELMNELETLTKGVYLLKECSLKAKDKILSFGERMSSLLFAQAVKNQITDKTIIHFDIRTILKTNSDFSKAIAQIPEISQQTQQHIVKSKDRIYISQGFIGSDENNATTTLGRGGSDYSAALIAEALNADVLEIWTDVAGIASTDPKICVSAKLIDEISYDEASELAHYGAKVLHPTTLVPAMRKNIPVFVGSSFESSLKGTWIKNMVNHRPLIRAITKRSKQSLLTIKSPKMLNAIGFMSNIFDVFTRHKISVDCVTTSEISVAISIDESMSKNISFIRDLQKIAEVDFENEYTLISIIGNNILSTAGIGQKVFNAIGNINVRMMCLGASAYNFNFLVEEKNAHDVVLKLHHYFLGAESESCTTWSR